ncbi:MAG: bifunctional hydroxymethylpyrimidine kinase/phosphomethylpyrimidine kinase [Schwartzia sp.]|nr:bifunctional hydroxymethylpyrimidine kinase/phosphomethylpyrimidine kinase [Schwartzia sp. (in: firmicutes)]
MRLPSVLSIAGSDSSGGAGIQADIKTAIANGVFAMTAVTALTAQNTTGVTDIHEAPPEFLGEEIDAVFDDIPPDAVKIGMVASPPLIRVIAEKLSTRDAKHIVVDPVIVAASGSRLLSEDAAGVLTAELFPLAEVVTPNLPELFVLDAIAGGSPESLETYNATEARVEAAKRILSRFGTAVLVKGGHAAGPSDDVLVTRETVQVFPAERIDTRNTHGTGCTLSTAIASNLAKGMALSQAVRRAKAFVTGALSAGLDLGRGSGPLHHGFALQSEFLGTGADDD